MKETRSEYLFPFLFLSLPFLLFFPPPFSACLYKANGGTL